MRKDFKPVVAVRRKKLGRRIRAYMNGAVEAEKDNAYFDGGGYRSFSSFSSYSLSGEDAYTGQQLTRALYSAGIDVEEAVRRIKQKQKQQKKEAPRTSGDRSLLF